MGIAVKYGTTVVEVKEMQSFLGVCSFFRKFVKGFPMIAKPFYEPTKDGAKLRRDHFRIRVDLDAET